MVLESEINDNKQERNVVIPEQKEIHGLRQKRRKMRKLYKSLLVYMAQLIITAIVIGFSLLFKRWDYIPTAIILSILGTVLIVCDYKNRFKDLTALFERRQVILLILFVLFAFADYSLIALEDEGIVGGIAVDVFIWIFWYGAIVLFIATFIAYWSTFAYFSSDAAWVHSFLVALYIYNIILYCEQINIYINISI